MPETDHIAGVRARLLHGMAFALVLFSVCLAGIVSKPHLGLSFFWPGNAFMLGMLVRFPRLNRLPVWFFCASAFFLADVVTGSDLTRNLALNSGNLASVGAGYYLLRGVSIQERLPMGREPTLYVLRAILVASLVAGMFGIFVNPLLFGGASLEGFLFWTATEMINYIMFLPVILTLPHRREFNISALTRRLAPDNAHYVLPLLALMASLAGAIAMGGGAGTSLFPIPALLWCAFVYDLFLTAWVSLAFSLWTMFALRSGLMWSPADLTEQANLIAMRLGVGFVAYIPIVVASIVAARNGLIGALRHLADHDTMTGLRNHRSFIDVGGNVMSRALEKRQTVAVLMLDIDHFKSINDDHGHNAGDQVLTAFANRLKNLVRVQDIIGRLGGDEFALIMPDCSLANAAIVAQRIDRAMRAEAILIDNGRLISVTVSIGGHIERNNYTLESSLTLADEALYRAKRGGRGRYEFSSPIPLTPAGGSPLSVPSE